MNKKLIKSKLIIKNKDRTTFRHKNWYFYQNQALRKFAKTSCSKIVKMKVAKPQYHMLKKMSWKKLQKRMTKNISSNQTKNSKENYKKYQFKSIIFKLIKAGRANKTKIHRKIIEINTLE